MSYGTQPGSYGTTVDVGNVVSYPVTLAPGNTYYVVVRAYNSLREAGPASNEASVVIPAVPTRADGDDHGHAWHVRHRIGDLAHDQRDDGDRERRSGGAQCHGKLPDYADDDVHGGRDRRRRIGHGLRDGGRSRASIAR